MPIVAERLLDTSVAVPLLVERHEHHERVFDALGDERVGLAGHAVFETYSVLTRLPPPDRLSPPSAGLLLRTNFATSVHLDADQTASVALALVEHDIAGGAVYDALVGAAAAHHGRRLVTRDARAVDVYRRIGAEVDVIG
jgi:toxin FitB